MTADRDTLIAERFNRGDNRDDIGFDNEISRQRVYQIAARINKKPQGDFGELSTRARNVLTAESIRSWPEFRDYVARGRNITRAPGCGKFIFNEISQAYSMWLSKEGQ